MALRYIDGFAYQSNADELGGWLGIGRGAYGSRYIVGNQLQMRPNGGANHVVYKALPEAINGSFVIGFMASIPYFSVGANGYSYVALVTSSNTFIMTLAFYPTSIALRINGATVASSPSAPAVNANHYYEVKVVSAASGGTVEVRMDGVAIINYTGNTTAGGVLATYINIGSQRHDGTTAGAAIYVSDLYLLDLTGTANNNFLGTVVVDVMEATGVGTYDSWTASGADTKPNTVNDKDANADWIASAVPGAKQSFVKGAIDTGYTVYGVEVDVRAAVEAAGSGSINFGLTNGTDAKTLKALTTDFVWSGKAYDVDPTGNPFTPALLNACQMMVETV